MGNKKEYNQYLWAPEQPRVYETSPLRISGTPMSEEDIAMSLRAENLQQSLQQNPIFKSAKQRVAQQKQREKEIAASKKWLELHPEDDNDDSYTIFERGKHQAIVNGKDPSYYEKMINDGKQFTKGALTVLSLPYLGAAAAGAYGYGASLGARGLFAAQGIHGLTNKNGVRKTVNLIKSGDYGRAALSGAGDTLNAAMIFPGVKLLGNTAKYGLKSTVAGDMLGQNVRNAALEASEPLLNVGWGPRQTLKVSRAGEYDQMYFPERWDVVNEGANPHGVWLQGKYGIPRTDLTNPGKGAKAARARNVFSTRSDKYTGTVTLDKPTVTIGEVPNRSSLSYQADNMGADGLIYNGVYDNGYNSNQVILSFRRPKLTKTQLSAAEWLGIPKGDRGNLSQDQLDALEDLTSYMQSGRYKNKFVIDQAGNFAWKSNLGPEDTLVPRAFADAKGDFGTRWARASTNEGTFKYINAQDYGAPVNGGFTAAFPKPEGMRWGPGELTSIPESKHSTSVIMTSPKVDAIDAGLEDPIVQSLSNTIDPGIVKNWWIRTKQMSRPGSYLSGDAGKFPIGFKLLQDVDNHKFGNIANDLLYPDITKIIGRQGLSPDSYASIVKQGLRDGNSLRFGEPFFKWNPSAVKNKYIYDTFIQYKNGEISIDQYKETVDNWLKSMGVNKQSFIKDGKLMIPHPFVYYNKQGGILKRK